MARTKMTPEEKAAQEQAQKAKRAAFNARNKEYRKAWYAAEEAVDGSEVDAARKAAVTRMEAVIKARNDMDAELLRQIAELEEKRKQFRAIRNSVLI